MSQHTLLHVIQNMEIGGAQRSASSLHDLPGVRTDLITYEQISSVSGKSYSGILLHVWCAQRDKGVMNWPDKLDRRADQFVVFNHDWRGDLHAGADAYIVYSKFAFDNSTADGEKQIVPGGIPFGLYGARSSHPKRMPCVVGRLSTLLEGKISVDLLNFWRDIKAARFVIGGDGPQRDRLLDAFSGDPRFEFPGQVRPRDVSVFMKEIDIFLYDTCWHTESFCYVVLEAMAAGCVVVAKAKGAIPELINHGVNGFLYTSDDQAITLCNSLIDDVGLRLEVGSSARTFASQYSVERFRSGVMEVFGW
jgi:glycosyltransferase involved in cell wall biosynthesis